MFRSIGKEHFEAIIRSAAVIPVLAFSLAIVHEATFFLVLGRSLFPLYQVSDFLTLSIAYVAIALAPLLIALLIDIFFRNKTLDEFAAELKIGRRFGWIIFIAFALLVVTCLYVVIFGGRLDILKSAIPALVFCISVIFGVFKRGNLRTNAFKYMTLAMFCMVSYSGAYKAVELRNWNKASLPRVYLIDSKGEADYQYLIRIVANGVIFLDKYETVTLVDPDKVSKITYNVDMTVWQGIRCELLDRCR